MKISQRYADTIRDPKPCKKAGFTHGRLTVLYASTRRLGSLVLYVCQCSCGKLALTVPTRHKSCGCLLENSRNAATAKRREVRKFTDSDIRYIRAANYKLAALATEFNCAVSTIHCIKTRKFYGDISEMSIVKQLEDKSALFTIATKVNDVANVCHRVASECGWWTDKHTGESLKGKRNVPEMLCLIHSEISEAMEGHRKNLMDDKLPHRKMIEVELADAMVRIMDLSGGLDLDLGGALAEKLAFNTQRPDHKLENRLKDGGKAY